MANSFGKEDFANLIPPSEKILITSIMEQVSSDALGELRLWLEQNPPAIPVSNILGFQQLSPLGATVGYGGSTTTTSAAMSDLSAAKADNLRAGKYLFLLDARVKVDASANTGIIGLRINGNDPSTVVPATIDNQRFLFNNTEPSNQSHALYMTLTGGPQTVQVRWCVSGGTATVYEVSLQSIKLSN